MSSQLLFDIGDLVLNKDGVAYPAVTITPKNPMTIDKSRLERLRRATTVNQAERGLIEQVRRRGGVRVVLFRAVNDAGERVWQFDPIFDQPQLEEAGIVMIEALLPLHRRLMAAGVMLMVHTDWGARECHAMRYGTKIMSRRTSRGPASTPLEATDHWLLTRMLLHVSLDIAHVTRSLLPEHLGLIEQRWARASELIARVPPGEID